MKTPAIAPAFVPASAPAALATFRERLEHLYILTQRNAYVFASPLGPFYHHEHDHSVPRFVYFGPHTTDASLRLAFHAGQSAREMNGALALLYIVERLTEKPALGCGLNLSFFPLVDVLGAAGTVPVRRLAEEHWGFSAEPEISLLEQEARSRGYHGFVVLVSTADEVLTVRLRGAAGAVAEGIDIVDSSDFGGWPVRFEGERVEGVKAGPLTVADDLPLAPFEITLGIPAGWPQAEVDAAVAAVLQRFIARHAAIQTYAQHL